MAALFRSLTFLVFVTLVASAAPATPVATPPPPVVPSTLDVVTFKTHSDDFDHKLVVMPTPTLLRVDVPEEKYSVIYNPQNEMFIGLEHSNYTYWQFSWPEIRAAVEGSKRYESRLQELTLSGVSSDSTTPSPAATTNAPVSIDAPANANITAAPDANGYTWKQTAQHKNIAGFDCVLWTGDTLSGESVQAWCMNGIQPKIQTALDRLHTINETMALVPLRPLVPAFVFQVYATLAKGDVMPIAMTWGSGRELNSFAVVDIKTRPGKPDLYTVPKLYMKTTLVSMDGLIDQKK
jgi:hypothetical protein